MRVYQPARRAQASALVLASTSRFRRALLESAGLPFTCVAPDVDESAPRGAAPRSLARTLALKKAQAVSARFPSALVIGSDQAVDLAGKLLRKPRSRAEARRQLTAMAGRSHLLHTAVALARGEPKLSRVQTESVRLTFRELSRSEIESYLDTGEWEGCAGGYRIEGEGIKLVRAVRGDYHAIVGLPMLRLLRMLEDAGFPLFAPGS